MNDWPSQEAFTTDDGEESRVYEPSDLRELLGGLVRRMAVLSENHELAPADALVTYRRVRRALITRPRAHQSMSPAQRTSLYGAFILCMRALVESRRATQTIELADGLRSLNEFPYAVALREKTKIILGDARRVMDQWPLREWTGIASELVKAFERCGAALEGARDAWTAHWDRFISLLDSSDWKVDALLPGASDDEDGSSDEDDTLLSPAQEEALRATGLLSPTASLQEKAELARQLQIARNNDRGVQGLYDDEEYTSRHAEGEPLLVLPLPYVRDGRRLRCSLLCILELRFHYYEPRFEALAAFEAATKRCKTLGDVVRRQLHALSPHTLMVRFLEWMAKHQDTITRHLVREKIGNPMAMAHLYTGEAERAFIQRMHRAIERGSPKEVINERPTPIEVLAELRHDAHKLVERYLANSGEHVKRVVEGYLRTETAAEKEWKPIPLAHDTERLALLLLPTLLDASLSSLGCKHRVMESSWIDELKHEHACPPPFFTGPEQAVQMCPAALDSGAMLVRILRRTFVVSPFTTPPAVIELPTLSSGLLLWLAFAYDIKEKEVPPVFRDAVKTLR